MHPNDKQKLQQAISLLQQLSGQKGGSSGVSKITIPGFDQQVNNFKQIGQQSQPQMRELTNILVQAYTLMQNILNYSAAAKAPNEAERNALQQKFMALSKKTQNVEKNPNFSYQTKAVRQILSVPFWVLSNTPQFIIKGSIQSADYNAIKFQKNKNQTHNEWWKLIGKSARILQDFTKRQYAMGLSYNNNGNANWGDIISGSGAQQAQQAPQHQPQPQPQNNPTVTQGQQKVQAPKAPKKQLQGPNWYVANINNQKIGFNPGQIQMKHGLFIENCNDCTISIDDKFKSLQMNKSSNITLIVNSCVSGVEAMNGQNIQIYIKGHTPSISVDKCQKVRIVLNESNMNTDIVTSKVSQMNVSYQKNGNEAKNFMIAQQLITRWNPDKKKFQTGVYDKFM